MKIRNPKFEIGNKPEGANVPMAQTRTREKKCLGVLQFGYSNLFRISSFVLGALFCLAVSGCTSWSSANAMQYVLDPGRPQQTASGQPPRVLDVDRFTIESAFATKSLVYRTSELRYQVDYYNEFLVAPAVMITEQTRDWLSRTGLFTRVTGPAARSSPTHLLEANIVELYGDIRNKKAPAAVMQIRCFFSRFDAQRNPTLLFARDYSVTLPIESYNPTGLMDTYSRCFQKILTDLQKDLADKLASEH